MLTTTVIAFREFLEAFLIIGVFLGVSKKLNLKKEKEIGLAAAVGIVFSLLLVTGTYIFGDHAKNIMTERNTELLEGYLLTFSGLFIAYVVFSLHGVIQKNRNNILIKAHNKIREEAFDISLFFTIVFLVLREGFEIALFTASVSLFFAFIQNFIGLIFGFAAATILGMTTFYAYIKFPIEKIFKATEYIIIFLGASLVQNGITKLFESHFNIHLSDILPIPLPFIPDDESVPGHMLKSFFGIDRELSLARLIIMACYIGIIYLLFIRQRKKAVKKII